MAINDTQRTYRATSELALLTTKDVAARLAISVVTVRRLVTSGQLGSVRIGGSLRFSPEAVSALIERQSSIEGEEPASRPALRDHADAGGGLDRE